MGLLKRSSLLILTLLTAAGAATAQPVLTARNMAMGGGGTAYMSGFEANFINPANSMIRTRSTSFMIGMGQSGYIFTPFLPAGDIPDHFQEFREIFRPFQPDGQPLNSPERTDVLLRNFDNNRILSEHQQRYDIMLGGLSWQHEGKTFTLAARSRVATRFELGRGWYDGTFIQTGTEAVRDLSLIQQTQYMVELSFGYAQRLGFIDGLIPKVGAMYIGLAPKLIIGGDYLDLNYDARYELQEQGNIPRLVQSFDSYSSGSFTGATETYRRNGDPAAAISGNHDPTLFTKPTGYGVGLDFGMTYVLALGDDMSLSDPSGKQPLKKSLRLGFSVTDIGFVSYSKSPLTLDSPIDTTLIRPASVTDYAYEGQLGQHISFFDRAEPIHNALQNSTVSGRETFLAILPSSINAGILLQTTHLKLSSDLTLGLNDTAFNNTKLVGHFGFEFTPIDLIPIRLGSRLAAGDPTFWSVGTGVIAKHWELSLATRFSSRSITGTAEFNGAVIGGLAFHF